MEYKGKKVIKKYAATCEELSLVEYVELIEYNGDYLIISYAEDEEGDSFGFRYDSLEMALADYEASLKSSLSSSSKTTTIIL